ERAWTLRCRTGSSHEPRSPPCHPERSEGPGRGNLEARQNSWLEAPFPQVLRCAQDDSWEQFSTCRTSASDALADPYEHSIMIKPDRWIRNWAEQGGVSPYEPSQVNAASYDVRVSDHWICPTRDPEEFRAEHVRLFPGEVVLASTIEHVRIPRTVACDLKL